MQHIFERLDTLQTQTPAIRVRKLCESLKKQVSKKINKISKKIEHISSALRSKNSTPSNKKDNFDFLRNEREFNYEITRNSDRGVLQFENDVRKMEMEELSRLTDSIQAINKLFTHMGSLVFEQGTLVDRIDANITLTVERVDNGNMQLVRAIEHQSSGLADLFIKILGFIVVGLTLLLFLKYS